MPSIGIGGVGAFLCPNAPRRRDYTGPATLDSRKENVKVEHMMGRTPQLYIVLGYNDYDMKSHQWYITPDLNEAKEIQSRWETLHLTCQIRRVGDRIDNPLSEVRL